MAPWLVNTEREAGLATSLAFALICDLANPSYLTETFFPAEFPQKLPTEHATCWTDGYLFWIWAFFFFFHI